MIDWNSQEYRETERLGILAQAVVSRPADSDAWVDMMINPKPPLIKGSEEFETACKLFLAVKKGATLENMLNYAFYLNSITSNVRSPQRRAAYALEWAIQQHLFELRRKRKLTEKEIEILLKTGRNE